MSCDTRSDNLCIPQGTTWREQWPLTDLAGAPLDLTGYTARAQARRNKGGSVSLYEWNTTNGGIVLTNSSLTLVTLPATSTAWTWTRGYYDIELTSPGGEVVRLVEGVVTVDSETTV